MGVGWRTCAVVVALMALVAGCGPRFPKEPNGLNAGTDTAGLTPTEAGAPIEPGAPGGDTTTTLASAVAGSVTTALGGTTGGTASGSGARVTVGTAPKNNATTVPAAGGTGTGTGAGVDPGPAPGVTDNEVRIGYLLPLTGAAPVPSNFDKGARVYWNYINAKGGINGRQVKIFIEDTQSSASVGKDKAKSLIESTKVFAIVVLDRLENQQAIGEYLDSRQFPNIEIQTPANLNKAQSWTFGVTIDHAVQGRLIADYFVKVLKQTKAAIVYENTPALAPGRDAFTQEMNKLGGQVVYSTSIDGQENDFSQQALNLSQKGAGATWLYMAPTPAAKLANQADVAGYRTIWFANSISWNFDLIFKVAPKALAGARAFSPWLPLSDPRTKTYQDAYRSQTGEPPDDLGIVGWGVGTIVGAGLQNAGKALGQNGFRNAMQNLKFTPDIWAPLSFGPGVREGADVVAVYKESGGAWTLERDFTGSF